MTRRLIETYKLASTMAGRRGQPQQLDVTLKLEADLDGLVRQLAAAALVSRSKPKRASIAHGAVVLTVIQEGKPAS